MKLALFGLGKMGANMARRLCRGGIEVVGYKRSRTIVRELATDEGLVPADSPAAAIAALDTPVVPDSGEGRWTAIEAIEQGVAAPVMTHALFARFTSQDQEGYGNRLLSMMRNAFGGHAIIHNDNAARDAQGDGNA